ncbi:Outer membrane protein beta-barrel domain-containing protein [Pricia antarctica]|uniref:Outer membrane protein beta-barrel domain-containing protein n=1 Tax=Pricia antarctica TaxID=641691 RepID=A0A1G7I596_9FLAO|nr:porin family protein [Pricia antarctica]SDF07686.1 Outer membrane protein beta-barrel domain-containing protein [Pricia antarctica]
MKNSLLVAAFAMFSIAAFSQSDSGFGIKAGLNYNQNGDLTIESVGNAAEDIIKGSEGKVGYHVGVFGKLAFSRFYLRPELVYTKTQSAYNFEGGTKYDISRLDLPVLLGVRIIGPLHVFAGPAFQYMLSNDLENFNINDAEKDFTVGLHIGAGIDLGRLGLDVRYERGLSENEAQFVGENVTDISGRVDSRPSQVIFAVSLKL